MQMPISYLVAYKSFNFPTKLLNGTSDKCHLPFYLLQLNALLARTCSRDTATNLAVTALAVDCATTQLAHAAASWATTEPNASTKPFLAKNRKNPHYPVTFIF